MKTVETAVFGGGCFWCTEAVFSKIKGVKSVVSGYAGGKMENSSGHAEVVKIEFDPEAISYEKLLEVFWYIHNPSSLNRQGNDIGTQYRSIILYSNEDQKKAAENSRNEIQSTTENPIVTEIKPLGKFYEAESYHQKYFDKNPNVPYCNFVIVPKISHFEERFKNLLK